MFPPFFRPDKFLNMVRNEAEPDPVIVPERREHQARDNFEGLVPLGDRGPEIPGPWYIDNKVKLISATLNGEKTNVIDAVEEYIDNYLYNKETYYETEMYYVNIDSILNQEPLLKADWIATYYNTKFIW